MIKLCSVVSEILEVSWSGGIQTVGVDLGETQPTIAVIVYLPEEQPCATNITCFLKAL